jgi:hypothetical protein
MNSVDGFGKKKTGSVCVCVDGVRAHGTFHGFVVDVPAWVSSRVWVSTAARGTTLCV